MVELRSRKKTPSPSSPTSAISRGGGDVYRSSTSSTSLFAVTPDITGSSSVFAAVNALGFVISATTGSHVHLDLLGTGAFIPATLLPMLAIKSPLPASIITSQISIFLWAGRLSLFLFYRASILKHDARLADTLSTTAGAFGFWFISFLWGVFAALPHTLCLSPIAKAKSAKPQAAAVVALSAVGFLMSIAGIVIEIVADLQKWHFKSNNPSSTFIQSGLWSISQHPNYFGNLLVFCGLVLQNFGILKNAGWMRLGASFLSPLFLFSLFYGQATGAIANAPGQAVEKYGQAFVEYMEKTPLIFPSLWKKA